MRLTYLCVPLFALLLAGCGDDEDPAYPNDTVAPEMPADDSYGSPTDPSDDPMDMNDDTLEPNTDPMEPPEDTGTGLGTEQGTDSGEVTDPATGAGSGTTQ